jgi:Amt family ammonium transporter
VFLLWFGWFGFNGGSVLSADPGAVSKVFVTTSIAAASGAFGALLISYLLFKSYDITMVLNGILGGLVGITAGADQMGVGESSIIGFIAGGLIVLAVVFFDKVKVDDPVGAISVHLVGGIWGTLAVGIFGDLAGWDQFLSQLTGVGAVGLFCVLFSGLILYTLKRTVGIRVDQREEVEGLDINEHGMRAYPDFASKD